MMTLEAFGSPALHALKFTGSPIARLRATVAYYPPAYICPVGAEERGVKVVIHSVGQSPEGLGRGVVRWVYGVDDGGGGEAGIQCGFAEQARGKGVYRRVEAEVAMARDLEVLRSTIGGGLSGADVEVLWEEFLGWLFRNETAGGKDFGGVDARFGFSLGNRKGRGTNSMGDVDPEDFLGTSPLVYLRTSISPPAVAFRMNLLSRTVGVNKVVDEAVVRFRHVRRMEWILPGVEGTGREVVVGMVMMGGLRGGRVVGVRVGWDRVEVRRQVGDGVVGGEGGDGVSLGQSGSGGSSGREDAVHLAK